MKSVIVPTVPVGNCTYIRSSYIRRRIYNHATLHTYTASHTRAMSGRNSFSYLVLVIF